MADISKININGTEYNIKDTEARNQGPSLPTGGTIGQVLAKNSDTNGDAGWYNLRHLPSDKWYLPDGILESDVVIAYQFVNRLDEAEALININEGTEYPLSKIGGVTWNATKGLYIPTGGGNGITNSTLNSLYQNFFSAAFGYSDFDALGGNAGPGFLFSSNKVLRLKSYANNGYSLQDAIVFNGTGYLCGGTSVNGVLSGNWMTPPSIYRNGENLSISSSFTPGTSGYNKFFGHFDDGGHYTSCYISAIVVYNIILSPSQHLQLSNNIHALGGID